MKQTYTFEYSYIEDNSTKPEPKIVEAEDLEKAVDAFVATFPKGFFAADITIEAVSINGESSDLDNVVKAETYLAEYY